MGEHVKSWNKPLCATCSQPWPCDAERATVKLGMLVIERDAALARIASLEAAGKAAVLAARKMTPEIAELNRVLAVRSALEASAVPTEHDETPVCRKCGGWHPPHFAVPTAGDVIYARHVITGTADQVPAGWERVPASADRHNHNTGCEDCVGFAKWKADLDAAIATSAVPEPTDRRTLRLTGAQIASIDPPVSDEWLAVDWDEHIDLVIADLAATPPGPHTSREVTHLCPPEGSGTMPCCGRTPFEAPLADRMTLDPALVTCRAEPSREAE